MSGTNSITIRAPRDSQLLEQLRTELVRGGIRVDQLVATTGDGAKSAHGELISLVVGGLLSAAGLQAMSQILVAFVQRSRSRRIEIRSGERTFVLDGASRQESRAALDRFLECEADD